MRRTFNPRDRGSSVVGALGAIFAMLASPCCFPLVAPLSNLLGLGSIPVLRANSSVFIQVMTALSLTGQFVAYRQHRNRLPLFISALGAGLVVIAFYGSYHVALIYCALILLTLSGVWNVMISRRSDTGCCAEGKSAVVLQSVLTCPHCGMKSTETMPTDACLFFFDCPGCGKRLKPKAGDCCVFCSYGTVKCPPIQLGGGCTASVS